MMKFWHGRAGYFIIAFILYLLFLCIGKCAFDISFRVEKLYLDLMLYVLISYLIFKITKNKFRFFLLLTIFLLLINLPNLFKLAYFGAPIFIDDIFLAGDVFNILHGVYFVFFVLFFLLLITGVIFAIDIKKVMKIDVLILLLLLVLPVLLYPKYVANISEQRCGYTFWDQAKNYKHMGSLLYLYQAFARYQFETPLAPSEEEVKKAWHDLEKVSISNETIVLPKEHFVKRNVYIVVLESFWDPSKLKEANLSEDCFFPAFRKLIEEKNENYVLSPEFGGKTANAEFEVLCGQPVTFGTGVIFQTSLHNDIECLPRLLREEGYDVSSWQPNRKTFFNAEKSYEHIGFTNRFFKERFKYKDKNGPFLADKELYETVLQYNNTIKNRPHLTYIMIVSGHWGYPLNKEHRQKFIKTNSKITEVNDYVNCVYYTSKEFIQFYETIKKDDPDAIVVVMGDHLPYLGKNFGAYVESKVLTSAISDLTPKMAVDYASTPLLVLDGKDGKVNVGRVPMYDIPHIILALLGYKKKGIFTRLKNRTDMIIRTYKNKNLVFSKKGGWIICNGDAKQKECLHAMIWSKAINIISRDLCIGEQFSEKLYE